MPTLSRRRLVAAVGGASVATVAGVGVAVSGEKALVASIISRVIGPHGLSDEDFTAFVADLRTYKSSAARAKFALYRAFSETDPDTLLRFAPVSFRDQYAAYERRVVTNFLTRTDYLFPGKKVQTTFLTAVGCRNPFAKFQTS